MPHAAGLNAAVRQESTGSKLGDYGPANFQLAHLACNLGKNNATEAQFHDWLEIAKAATDPLTN